MGLARVCGVADCLGPDRRIAATGARLWPSFLMGSSMVYDVVKALHIVAVIAWMAGLLYLPRLFVYHADAPKGSPQSETFKVMERRLYRGIMNPAMILVWIFGLALAQQGNWWHAGWWQVKVALVVGLTFVHHLYSRWRKE